jgi:hypothetical protein
MFAGSRDLRGDKTNVLEIRSPSTAADQSHVEDYVQRIRRVAEQVPYDGGYASLALTWGVDSQKRAFADAARRWAFRHPGFDMPNKGSSRFSVGAKLRGAYWLTFVGPKALETLGGEAGLRKALPKEINVQPAGAGVMLRASQLPDVGDVNQMQPLPELRAMAKVLEKVSLFGDTFLNNLFTDEDQRARWERRHLD